MEGAIFPIRRPRPTHGQSGFGIGDGAILLCVERKYTRSKPNLIVGVYIGMLS